MACIRQNLEGKFSGQKQYLFADVRKAIRTRFSRSVTTVRDAIDALIDEEIVQANVARKA